ncbi:MAG: ATP-binding protein [Patescibacteria group bacterium]|nr:ATP-binding protein [Patescibacteria group bacterium]
MVTKDSSEEKKLALLADDLASLENYIHDLFSFSPLPICFISPIGVVLEINPAFEDISGFKSYEVIGEPIEQVFDKKQAESLTKETLKQGFIAGKEMSFSPKAKDKMSVQVFTRARKDEAGEVVGYFLGFFDLTKIKEAEGELQQAQLALMNILEDTEEARKLAEEERNKTQEIINSLTDGLMVFNSTDSLALMNPQSERFLEIKREELIGKQIKEFVNFEQLKNLIDLIGENIEENLFRQEFKIRENFILELSTIPLMSNKTKIGTLLILHDISREKVIERMKNEFVSIAAHQLRTPLSAIKWTLRMLLDGDLGKITEEQSEFIAKTYQSNERMISLINDLLNVTRIEEGRYLYKPVLTDIKIVLQFVINSYKEEGKKRNIKLELRGQKKKTPKVFLDVEKIKLAFQNLIDNAIKYTMPGGKIVVSLVFNSKEITVSVKDNGVGILQDQQERVFGKFFRGSNVIKMETDGSGLGLFIAKNIIESHGGRIWFESKLGKGTTFHFTIPIKKAVKET